MNDFLKKYIKTKMHAFIIKCFNLKINMISTCFICRTRFSGWSTSKRQCPGLSVRHVLSDTQYISCDQFVQRVAYLKYFFDNSDPSDLPLIPLLTSLTLHKLYTTASNTKPALFSCIAKLILSTTIKWIILY